MLRHRRGRVKVVGIAFVFALGTTVGMSAAQSAPTADPIKLMAITAVQTPIQNYPDVEAATKAAALAINKRGGVKGRTIEVSVCNTQSNANQAAACARRAVEEQVVAVVGETHNLNASTLPILASAKIASIGLVPFGTVADWSNPYSFPFTAGNPGSTMSLVLAYKALGLKRIAVVSAETATALGQAKMIRNTMRAVRMQYAGLITVPAGATDHGPYAQRIRELGADSVILVVGMPTTLALMRTADSLGIRVQWGHNAGTVGEDEAKSIGASSEGMLLGSNYPSFRETSYAGIRAFNAEMQAAGYTEPINHRQTSINAWLSVKALETVAKSIKGEVTAASVLAAIRKPNVRYKLYDLIEWMPGAIGPRAYPRYSNDKQFFLVLKDGKIVPETRLKPVFILKAQNFVR